MNVVWTESALDDLDLIRLSPGRRSSQATDNLIARLYSAPDILGGMPRFGAAVPDYDDPDFREMLVEGYRVVYRIRDDAVNIVGVVHGSRRLPRGLEKY